MVEGLDSGSYCAVIVIESVEGGVGELVLQASLDVIDGQNNYGGEERGHEESDRSVDETLAEGASHADFNLVVAPGQESVEHDASENIGGEAGFKGIMGEIGVTELGGPAHIPDLPDHPRLKEVTRQSSETTRETSYHSLLSVSEIVREFPRLLPVVYNLVHRVPHQQETESGGQRVANGRARVVGEGQLKVSFFGPIWADYWVLARADDYAWSIVGEPGGRFLWLLTRDENLSAAQRASFEQRITALGFDPNDLVWARR